jgi:hypothetical protein
VLDTSNMRDYLRAFLRRAPGRPRLWGLHNYQDVNRRTSGDTREMLRLVPGRVWLTETGGIVRFGESRQFRYSESRAARFDAGLVNSDGTPRRAYSVVAEHARSHR